MSNEARGVPSGSSVAYDPDGFPSLARSPIVQQTAGGRSVAAGAGGNANVQLTNAPAAGQRSFIQQIIAQCTVVPTADGTITFLDGTGGTVLFNMEAETSNPVGTQQRFVFNTPIPTSVITGVFVTLPANTGTWRFYIDGYDMTDARLT